MEPPTVESTILPHPDVVPEPVIAVGPPEPEATPPPAPPPSTAPPAPKAVRWEEKCCPMPPLFHRTPWEEAILAPKLSDGHAPPPDVRELSIALLGAFALGAGVAFTLAYFSRAKVTDA